MDQEEWKAYEAPLISEESKGVGDLERETKGLSVAESILDECDFMLSQLKRDIKEGKKMSEALRLNFIDYTGGFGDKGYGFMANVIRIDEDFCNRHNLGEKFDEERWIGRGLKIMKFNESGVQIHLVGGDNPNRARVFINKDTERLTQELSDKIREHPRDEEVIIEDFLENGGKFSSYRDDGVVIVVYLPFSIDYDHPLAERLREYRMRNVRTVYRVEEIYDKLYQTELRKKVRGDRASRRNKYNPHLFPPQ